MLVQPTTSNVPSFVNSFVTLYSAVGDTTAGKDKTGDWRSPEFDVLRENVSVVDRSGYHQDVSELFASAARTSDTRPSGLCMGFMFPDATCDVGSSVFREGIRHGQAYYYRLLPASIWGRGIASPIGLGICAAAIWLRKTPILGGEPVEELVPVVNYINEHHSLIFLPVAVFAYGLLTMKGYDLFDKFDVLPDKLITLGPFALHRNPFWASLTAGMLMILCLPQTMNEIASGVASVTAAVAALFGLGVSAGVRHVAVKHDEKSLERQFGQEYLDYKKKTPRYFPAIWKPIVWAWNRARRS
jgi:protein-S-isoprenylcysteine O-methyltransferase Ste14